MYKYVLKRLLLLIPILLGVTFIVFSIMAMTPGDPGRMILGNNATKQAVTQLNHQLGYDKPFIIKFVNYVKSAVTGDFGLSYTTRTPVFDEIFAKFPTTLILAMLGVLATALLGIPLGILSAIKQYSKIDVTITVFAMLLASIPTFWFGLMLILLFSLYLGILPAFGIGSIKNFILPTITLALPGAAGIMRLTRSTMLEAIRADYIRTARAKGASETLVIWRHALRNALLPIITVLGMTFGGLLGGVILVEKVFGMPGLGSLMLTAIVMKDIPMVMACTIFLATLFCLIMLAVDLLYAFIDPRIKAQFLK